MPRVPKLRQVIPGSLEQERLLLPRQKLQVPLDTPPLRNEKSNISNMNSSRRETVADKVWSQRFAISRSKWYHAHRMAWHQRIAYVLQFIELFATSSILLGLVGANAQRWVLGLAAIVTGMSLVQLSGKHFQWHAAKKEAFGELMKMIPEDEDLATPELLHKIVVRREEIEKDDDKGFPCLDIVCHNEECNKLGLMHDKIRLSWWRRNVGTILPLDYIPSDQSTRLTALNLSQARRG